MKIREELILKALAGEETKVELAAKYGASRKTLYKWLDRYKERGLAGLVDESRRPRSSPMVTSPELALAAMQLRKAHPSWGPKKVVAVLARQYPGEAIPSVSTTSRILRQAGFKTRMHRRSSGGFPPAPRQFTPVEPNDLWTVDFKGWWRTLDGTRCDPLTVRDAVSRYVLAMRGMTRTRTEEQRCCAATLGDIAGRASRRKIAHRLRYRTNSSPGSRASPFHALRRRSRRKQKCRCACTLDEIDIAPGLHEAQGAPRRLRLLPAVTSGDRFTNRGR